MNTKRLTPMTYTALQLLVNPPKLAHKSPIAWTVAQLLR